MRMFVTVLFPLLLVLLLAGMLVVLLIRSFWVANMCLVLIGYLVMLNGYLRGSAKHHIDAFLSVCFLLLALACFVLFGWQVGLVSIVLPMVAGAVLKSLAQAHAHCVLSY